MKTTIHNEAEFWATAAVTGGLTETELEALRDHMAACPSCKKLYEEELAMGTLIKQTLSPECPDPGFERRIISNFRQAYAGKVSRWNEFFRLPPILIGAAACVALMALVGTGFLMEGKKPSVASAAIPESDFQSLPPAVQKTVQDQWAGKTVSNIERVDDNGDISYDIEATDPRGEQWSLTVAQDGTLLSVETTLAEVPAAVQTAIKTAAGQGNLEEIDKNFDDGETTYVASITGANGREHDFTFEDDGTLSSEEVDKVDLTPSIQTAIDRAVGQDKLEGIDKTFDDGKITYDATVVTPDGKERDISISTDGDLLSREVMLTEAPAAVRQTISQTLGKGKLEEIDQSFVAVNHVMPYEVEGQKDGKPFDFTVSPTGNFLGMEE